MTATAAILAEPMVKRLGWALLHSMWQGAAVAIVFAIALRVLRRGTANVRYGLGLPAMVLMLVLPVSTFFRTDAPTAGVSFKIPESAAPAFVPPPSPAAPPSREAVWPRPQGDLPVETSAPTLSQRPWKESVSGLLERALPWVVTGWLIGVFLLSLRLLGGWAQMQRLKRRLVKPVAARWRETVRSLSERMRVTLRVRVLESAVAQVPTVIGFLKPVILLPASALSGLRPEQLESLLAHELAHIRRHDYLFNLVQAVVETLLFYHPAVWWVSHRVRVEREHCCDDLAVAVIGDKAGYVRALTEMEKLRGLTRRPAVAASGGSLFDRVRRLVNVSARNPNRSAWWLAGAVVITTVLALAVAARLFCFTSPPEKPPTREVLAKNPQRLAFGGLDLSGLPCETDPAKLPDLFEPGPESGPHRLRKGVEIVHQDGLQDTRGNLGTVYFVKEKSVFYIKYGPPPWRRSRQYYGPFEGDPREELRLETDARWLNRLWVTWLADRSVVNAVADLGYPGAAAKAIIRGWTPATAQTSAWEIRTADNRRRVARIPFPWRNSPVMTLSDGRRIESGPSQSRSLRLDRSQLHWLSSLEDGDYLLAWSVGGRRVSNVLRLRIDRKHDIKSEPLLRLIEIEPPPGRELPFLGLRAYRRTEADPAPLASAVAFPTLVVDGKERRVSQMTWTGPNAPLRVGHHYTYLLDPAVYRPEIKPGKQHVIVAKVGERRSSPLMLTYDRPLGRSWDRATPGLAPAPTLERRVVLTGSVIGSDGTAAQEYDIHLADEQAFREIARTNEKGEYAFYDYAVPLGQYEVSACPHGKGQPMLTLHEVKLDGKETVHLDLSLERRFGFSGRVTYADGTPVRDWTVMATWPSPDGTAEFNDFAKTDRDGHYTLHAPYEIASFVGWGGKHVKRGVKAGRNNVNFVLATQPPSRRDDASAQSETETRHFEGEPELNNEGATGPPVRALSDPVEIETLQPVRSGNGNEGTSGEAVRYTTRYKIGSFELHAGFTPDKAECIFGEPMFVTFSVENLSDKAYPFFVGGDIRGSVRHNRFRITAVDALGQPVKDPYSYAHFGGPGGDVVLEPGKRYTERLYLSYWCAFEKPGVYDVTCKRTLDMDGSGAQYPPAPIVTTFKLTIHPFDKKAMQGVIAELGKKLREGDEQAVYEATLGLAAIDDEKVIPHLALALTKGDYRNRRPAVEGLSRFSTGAAADALISALKDPDYAVAEAAGRALQTNKMTGWAVDALLKELGSVQPAVRALAARALGYTGSGQAFDPLVKAMKDAEPAVRQAAAESLGKLGDKAALGPLRERVVGHDMGLRVAAAKGLRALGQPLQVEWLTPVIKNATSVNDQNFHESIRLIRLYGKERAAPALIGCLNFDDATLRNSYNFFILQGIEASPGGPKCFSIYHHDPNVDGTPQEIEENRKVLDALKAWLADSE